VFPDLDLFIKSCACVLKTLELGFFCPFVLGVSINPSIGDLIKIETSFMGAGKLHI